MNPLAIISVDAKGGAALAESLAKNKQVKYFGNIYSRKVEPQAEWYQWIKTQVYQDSNIHFKKDRLDMQSAFITTLFLRTDVEKKDVPLLFIDHADLDEYHELLDLFKMGKFKIIHFRRNNLIDVMINSSKSDMVINIQDTVSKMRLIEKQQELLKEELRIRDVSVLDVSFEEYDRMWNRISMFLGWKEVKYSMNFKPSDRKKAIKNYDEFTKALQYTEFAGML